MFITLHCNECENNDCTLYPLGKYLSADGKYGCTREVSEADYDKYEHLMYEVAPFMYIKTSQEQRDEQYKDIINFLHHIYSCPLGNKLGKSGKALNQVIANE